MIKNIDETDRAILRHLYMNSNETYSQIGRELGVSRTTVKNRVAELEKSGIIRGYRAVIDFPKAKERITFILNFDVRAESFEEAKKKLYLAPETKVLFQTAGRFHLVAICEVEKITDMRDMVNKLYREVEGIEDNITCFPVLDMVKGGFTE